MNTVDEKIKSGEITASEVMARPSLWKRGGLSWRELARRVWDEIYAGGLLTHAAALAFYFFFALFPLLLFLVTLLGFFAESGTALRENLLNYLRRLVPPSAFTLIYETVDEIGVNADGAQLWLGLLSALWFASLGIAALSESLNAMYGVRESRAWLRVRLSAVALTIALVILIMSALLMTLYGGEIGSGIADYFRQGTLFATVWTLIQVPLVLVFVLVSFALIYYFAPDVYDQKWYWITPGSITGVALWLLVSFVLRLYLRHFDSYSLTYGSLGAVIILMLWFYLTGVAILIGGKINAEIENAAAKAGVPEAKPHGEKTSEEQPADNLN
ncbi:MAG TPA: YihY/virulence factor BrkB family protein [Pyrinomonadaceae bacterium]|nr:YihY/virulence factor BrkB family protein [Pyrinomonadaceae bacterium]